MGFVVMGLDVFMSHRRGFGHEDPVPLRDLPRLTVQAIPALLMPISLLFCLCGGITTRTLAAAIAALHALIIALKS